MAMLCVRSQTPLSVIDASFGETSINVPKAPALGLLLEEPVYSLYNSRVEEVADREAIDFDKHKVSEKARAFQSGRTNENHRTPSTRLRIRRSTRRSSQVTCRSKRK